jgi:hypothetical protein
VQWGQVGDIPVPGEWHINNWYTSCDLGVWRPLNGTWYAKEPTSGASVLTQQWGTSGDVPVPGNYNGNGGTDLAVYRNGTWYIKYLPQLTTYTYALGLWNDIPVPSDFGGTYINTDLGVWRPSNGQWFVRELFSNRTLLSGFTHGQFGDVPVPANYDGAFGAELAVFRPSNSTWYIRNVSGTYVRTIAFGTAGDIPAPMDFNGDGRSDLCVFRPTNGYWYCRQVDGTLTSNFSWGTYTDIVAGSHHR